MRDNKNYAQPLNLGAKQNKSQNQSSKNEKNRRRKGKWARGRMKK